MNRKALLGYVFYGVAVTVFFLYWLFPSAILERTLQTMAEDRYGLTLSVERASLTVPPGLRMARGAVAIPGRPDLVMEFRDIVIRPRMMDLARGKLAFAYHCRSHGGTLQGAVSFSNRFSMDGPMDLRAVAANVNLRQATWLGKLTGRPLEGTFRATVELRELSPGTVGGSGRLDLSLESGSFFLQEPFMGFDKFAYDRIEIKADLEESVLTVRSINLQGPDLEGTISGTVHLHTSVPNSRIALRGSASVPAMGSTFPLTLGGTLVNPRIRVGRS